MGVPHPWMRLPHLWTWGHPIPGWGIPPSGPNQGTPCLDLTGISPHLDLAGVQPPVRDLGAVTGLPPASWEGTWDQSLGYPQKRTWDQWKYYGMEVGYHPPSPRCGQTPMKTVPSRRTTYAGGKSGQGLCFNLQLWTLLKE